MLNRGLSLKVITKPRPVFNLIIIFGAQLTHCVTVAQQILVLSVKVRILVGQQKFSEQTN
jgi:hypothetical protein